MEKQENERGTGDGGWEGQRERDGWRGVGRVLSELWRNEQEGRV